MSNEDENRAFCESIGINKQYRLEWQDLMHRCSVQTMLVEMIKRGWTIKPPKEDDTEN